MREYRCENCKRLLFKVEDDELGVMMEDIDGGSFVSCENKLECKCPKCKKLNYFNIGIKQVM